MKGYEILSPFLCGYKKGYCTQQPLVSLIEKWRTSLDNQVYGVILVIKVIKVTLTWCIQFIYTICKYDSLKTISFYKRIKHYI